MTQQTLPSLRVLDLHGNQLSSTTGLQLPSLQQLYLASNQLVGLEGLGALRQLTTLHLRENKLSSLSGLPPSMEALQYLNLRANAIAELSEVNQLQSLPFLRALILAGRLSCMQAMCKCVQAVPCFVLHTKKGWGRSLPAWEQSYNGMHGIFCRVSSE